MQRLARLEAENRALRDALSAARQTAARRQRPGRDTLVEHLQAENRLLREQLTVLQRRATIGTLTAMVAHEFNNILTPVINYAQLARTNPEMTDKALTRAADGGLRATGICQAILGLSRGEEDPLAEVDVAALIAETVTAMGRDPQRDGIELSRLDIPAWSAGVTATTRLSFHHVADLQVPIACADVAVYPGDVIHGDVDSITVIPAHLAAEMADLCEAQDDLESYLALRVQAGEALWGLYPPSLETREQHRAWVAAGRPALPAPTAR